MSETETGHTPGPWRAIEQMAVGGAAAETMLAEHDGLAGANPAELTWDALRAAIAEAKEGGGAC